MVRTYQPGGLFSAGVDPIRLQAALQQQRPQFKPQAVRMLSAPTTVIQEKNPLNSLGTGMEGLASGIKGYRKQGREDDARAALEGLYAQPAGVSGPEPGLNTFRPGAAQLGRVAAGHVGTKAGAYAGALFADMQAQDARRQEATVLADRAQEGREFNAQAAGSRNDANIAGRADVASGTRNKTISAGRAWGILGEMKTKIAAGETLSPEDLALARTAHFMLSSTPVPAGTDQLGRPIFGESRVPDLAALLGRGAPQPAPAPGIPVSPALTGDTQAAINAEAEGLGLQAPRAPAAKPPATESPVPLARSDAEQKRMAELRGISRTSGRAIQTLNEIYNLSEVAFQGDFAELGKAGAGIIEGVAQVFNPEFEIKAKTASTEMTRLVLEQLLPRLKQLFGNQISDKETELLQTLQASLGNSIHERRLAIKATLSYVQGTYGAAQADMKKLTEGRQMSPVPAASQNYNFATMTLQEFLDARIDVSTLNREQLLQMQGIIARDHSKLFRSKK
jgi:hypothetical protein